LEKLETFVKIFPNIVQFQSKHAFRLNFNQVEMFFLVYLIYKLRKKTFFEEFDNL